MTSASSDVASNLASIKETCVSYSPTVRLVAVSKTKPMYAIQEAYDAGHRVFGENYVQELIEKAGKLPSDIEWHFIGSLQSNKAKMLVTKVSNLRVVETVSRAKIANALDKACAQANRNELLDIFVQVNVSDEDSKSGCSVQEAPEIVNCIKTSCPHLRVKGLMVIGNPHPPTPDHDFQQLRKLRDHIDPSLELSMGMSHDYEIACQCGSTNVRVGSSIFGARQYKTV